MVRTAQNTRRQAVTRRMAVLSLAFGGTGLLAACSAPIASPTSAPSQAKTVPTSAAPQAAQTPAPATPAPRAEATAPRPPTQAPAKPKVAKVTIAQGSATLSFAPVYVARVMKLFEDEMIDGEVQYIPNQPPAVAALISGDLEFVVSGSNNQFDSHEKGLGFLTVAATYTSIKMEAVARNDFLQRKGITLQHPAKDRIGALKGAKIGVSSLTGAVINLDKYALKAYGLDPENDVEFVAIPSGPPIVAALRAGQIDAFVLSPPDPELAEAEGFATVFVKLGDELPAFKSIMNLGIFGRRNWIEANPDVTERFCRAIGRANNIIMNDLPAAKEAVKTAFPQVAPEILNVSMDRLKTAFSPDARMTEEMWKNMADVYLFSGTIKSIPPLAEGTLWTNKYLVNVPKR